MTDRSLSPSAILLAAQAAAGAQPTAPPRVQEPSVYVVAQPVYLAAPGYVPPTGYGDFFARFFAWLVDDLVCGLIGAACYLFAACVAAILVAIGAAGDSAASVFTGIAAVGLAIPLTGFACFAYFIKFETGPSQATLGKQLLGLKITNQEGGRITAGQSLGRLLVKSIFSPLFFAVGFWITLFTDRKQSLHDMAASTLVVRAR